MQRKSFLVTAALAAGLALGIFLSPITGSFTASAQTQPPAAQTQTTASANSLQSLFLDKLAAALGIQRSALDTAVSSAGTSAVDQALADGTLSQTQADALKAQIAAGDIGALWGGRGGRGGPQVDGLQDAMLAAVAQKLNMTTTDVRSQLTSGQTLAQLAQAHNTTEQALIDAALAAAKTKLAAAVTAGTLTQAQADAKLAQLQAAGANILVHGGRGPRGEGPGTPVTPQAAPSTQAGA